MTPATIRLFLPRGDTKSLRTAEISNWTCKAVAAPRTELDELLAREELDKAGVRTVTQEAAMVVGGWWLPLAIIGGAAIMAPYYYSPYYEPPPVIIQEQPPVYVQPTPSSTERIFVYPRQGQSEELLAKDRYECHSWAMGQTGYDPTQPSTSDMPEAQRNQMRADYQRAQGTCLDGRGYTMR
jgi:hypothetical protein